MRPRLLRAIVATTALALVAMVLPAIRAADPARPGDVVEVIVRMGTCTRFLAALRAANKVNALREAAAVTVFVPDDDAFAKLPPGTLDNLLRPENTARLTALLDYHRVPDRTLTAANLPRGKLPAANGAALEVVRNPDTGNLTVNGARILRADVPASNGVVHLIDRVMLLPPAP